MFVESDDILKAVAYAKKHCEDVSDWDFDSGIEVDSWEPDASQAEEYMDKIWIEGGKTMSYDEYMDALEEQGDLGPLED